MAAGSQKPLGSFGGCEKAAEKMPADKSERERSAKTNFETVTACEVALETEEEKLKMRHS